MKRPRMTAVIATCISVLAACSSSKEGGTPDGQDGGTTDGGATDDGSDSSSGSGQLESPDSVNAYLQGKSMVMTGADIPPNVEGSTVPAEDGSCLNKVTAQIASPGLWNITYVLATVAAGICDNSTVYGDPFTIPDELYDLQCAGGNAACFDSRIRQHKYGNRLGRARLDQHRWEDCIRRRLSHRRDGRRRYVCRRRGRRLWSHPERHRVHRQRCADLSRAVGRARAVALALTDRPPPPTAPHPGLSPMVRGGCRYRASRSAMIDNPSIARLPARAA